MKGWMWMPLAIALFAGCVDEPEERTFEDAVVPGDPVVDWDVTAAVDWWEALVTAGKRDAYLPDTPATHNGDTRAAIGAALESAGYTVETREYDAGAFVAGVPPTGPVAAHAVIGHRPGSEMESRIALVAHYDTQAATIQGAYDNGSGTTAVVHACEALAKVETRRGIDCLLFDAEEVGVVASRQYVDEASAAGVDYDLVIGFDMVGINWPGHDWKMYHFVGGNVADWLAPWVRTFDHETMGYPESGVEVRDTNTRNSDESTFASAGYPTIRFAGGERAGDYPEYHTPNDTPAFIYDFMGGRDKWEAGYAMTVETAYAMVLAYDATELGADA